MKTSIQKCFKQTVLNKKVSVVTSTNVIIGTVEAVDWQKILNESDCIFLLIRTGLGRTQNVYIESDTEIEILN
jgi:hypothetical protein